MAELSRRSYVTREVRVSTNHVAAIVPLPSIDPGAELTVQLGAGGPSITWRTNGSEAFLRLDLAELEALRDDITQLLERRGEWPKQWGER